MPEWKERITKSPANWLNELQEQYYVFADTLRIMVLSVPGDGWLYALVMVGEKGIEGLMDAMAEVPECVWVSND